MLFNGPQLGAYLGANIAAGLIAQGIPQAQAQGQAEALAKGLATIIAQVPVGAAAFTNSLYDQPYLVASYRAATARSTCTGSTWQRLSCSTADGRSPQPIQTCTGTCSATPPARHRQTPWLRMRRNAGRRRPRYEIQVKRYSAEVRGRYADAFPVNSGVLNSYNIGTPVPYAPVPVNALLDAGVSWVVPFAGSPRLSLNATEPARQQGRDVCGSSKIGRLIMTRVQYQY